MASLSIENTHWTNVVLRISDLQTAAQNYDEFVLYFYSNGSLALTDRFSLASSVTSFTRSYVNPNFLGNNWFSPATYYYVEADAVYNGVTYPIGIVGLQTDAPTAPSGSIAPSVYPTIKYQGSTGSCTADAITSALEIAHAKAMGRSASYANYSVMYFYGTDNLSIEGMDIFNAIQSAVFVGSARWELVETSFPQYTTKAQAQALFSNKTVLAERNGIKNSASSYLNIDFYDTASVKAYIQQYGFFLFSFRVPNNFYSIPSTGIVPQPSGGWSDNNHTLCLIGLTTINGKPHWIGINSWGTSWGASGLCYIPYDWGCGVQSPRAGKGNTDGVLGWTVDCYALLHSGVDTNHPSVPTITKAEKSQDGSTAIVTFSDPNGAGVLIYARQRGTAAWWPKTPTGSQYGYIYYSSPATIKIDSATTEYEVSAIAVGSNNLLSLRSSVVTVDGQATDNVRIYNSGWKSYTPYVWTGSRWQQSQTEVHDGGGFDP